MQLNTLISGESGPLPPIVMAHGLFGSARNLGGLARRFAGRRVVQVDMRNHGDSPWSETHDYPAMAADLKAVIGAEGGVADVIGHSMGGKAAMVLALMHREAVRRLVVLDIAPLPYGHSQDDVIDAMEAVDLAQADRRSEADRLLAAGIEDASVRAFLLQSLDVKASPPRWKMNLAALRAAMPQLTGWPGDAVRAGAFEGPVLALRGGESDYVDDEGEAALRRYFPQAELREIEGTGHWLHAEKADAVGDAVTAFLG